MKGSAGFTIIEVLFAIIVLSVGVLALAGTSGMVTRMVGEGKHTTAAVQAATRKLETLRRVAASPTQGCADAAFASGGPTAYDGVTTSWIVDAWPTATSSARRVRVTYSMATARGTRSNTLTTVISCR